MGHAIFLFQSFKFISHLNNKKMKRLKHILVRSINFATFILALSIAAACSDEGSEESIDNVDNGENSGGDQGGEGNDHGGAPSHVVAVDLGLSVKWASCNVGATSPEDFGGYYAWGETEEKANYSWETYKWCNGTGTTITKYCSREDYGIVDGRPALLEPTDDVAHVKWGGSWRMPTWREFEELLQCAWRRTTINDVDGYLFTSPTNGNSIFLPIAGWYINENFDTRAIGHYWSATGRKNDNGAYCLWLGGLALESKSDRSYGFSVRPVME